MSESLTKREQARKKPHYVSNSEFTDAVVEYVKQCQSAEKRGHSLPTVPTYIAECFIKISQGVSHRPNFVRYTYRDDMVMDGVENCLRAIRNYDINAATRSGRPNAFAYFTQIVWFAFLRRINKEKHQHNIKVKYLTHGVLDQYLVDAGDDVYASETIRAFVEELRSKVSVAEDDRTKYYDMLTDSDIAVTASVASSKIEIEDPDESSHSN